MLACDIALRRGEFELRTAFELGSTTVLVGPNGSGKSTLLECLAGLARPDRGHMALGNRTLFDAARRRCLPADARRIGYVFQEGALFPHLTVAQNVGYAPGARDVTALLERFGLAALAGRWPGDLSGGERQRAAVARALAAGPEWLLLDEPFAALDAAARPAVRRTVRDVLEERGVPALLVTHDYEEALGFAERVLVLEHGRIVEDGEAGELLARPRSAFAAALAGQNHFLGRIDPAAGEPGMSLVCVGVSTVWAPASALRGQVAVIIDPAEITLARDPGAISARNRIAGRVEAIQPDGGRLRVRLAGELPLTALVTAAAGAELELAVGLEVVAVFKVTAVRVV